MEAAGEIRGWLFFRENNNRTTTAHQHFLTTTACRSASHLLAYQSSTEYTYYTHTHTQSLHARLVRHSHITFTVTTRSTAAYPRRRSQIARPFRHPTRFHSPRARCLARSTFAAALIRHRTRTSAAALHRLLDRQRSEGVTIDQVRDSSVACDQGRLAAWADLSPRNRDAG